MIKTLLTWWDFFSPPSLPYYLVKRLQYKEIILIFPCKFSTSLFLCSRLYTGTAYEQEPITLQSRRRNLLNNTLPNMVVESVTSVVSGFPASFFGEHLEFLCLEQPVLISKALERYMKVKQQPLRKKKDSWKEEKEREDEGRPARISDVLNFTSHS